MGHHYRERHSTASTTTDDLTGLTGQERSTEPSEDWTLEELREEAKSRDLPYYGTKAELVERLTQ